jgi:hypothetical protein
MRRMTLAIESVIIICFASFGRSQTAPQVHQTATWSTCSNIVALSGAKVDCSNLTPAQKKALEGIPSILKMTLENRDYFEAVMRKLDEISKADAATPSINVTTNGANSPGVGVNTGIVSVVSGDAGLIHSFSITLTIDVPTISQPVTEPGQSIGMDCGAALLDKSGRRYRLSTPDKVFGDTQIAENMHRYTVILTPLDEDGLLGQKVENLTAIEHLGFDCRALLALQHTAVGDDSATANVTMIVAVNGIRVIGITNPPVPLSNLLKYQMQSDINPNFSEIPSAYAKQLAIRAAKQP